jgi:hypothetical protein
MPVKRHFVDWSVPILQHVADRLIESHGGKDLCDLSGVTVVFSGRQAGRRFLEVLTEQAGGRLSPPRIVTVGQLPELLYQPRRPFASILVQRLVWANALRELPSAEKSQLLSQPPDGKDTTAWLRLGELLRRQHAELAADRLNFADVCTRGKTLEGFSEAGRWQLLSKVQEHYLRQLDDLGLWDQQTARLVAIERGECHLDHNLATVGTVDLNRSTRAMLEQVSERVTVWLHAPPEAHDLFDEYGCLVPERWAERHIELDSNQVEMVDDANAQVGAVVRTLASFNGRYALDEVTIAVPDDRIIPLLKRTLEELDLPAHWPIVGEFSSTSPYRLLQAIADYLEEPATEHVASLLRHPDVTAWLNQQFSPDWLNTWDNYVVEHLPRNLESIIPDRYASRTVSRLKQALDHLTGPFRSADRPLSQWSSAVSACLLTIYGNRQFDLDDPVQSQLVEACGQLQQAFDQHCSIPAELDVPVCAVEALRLTLNEADGELYAWEGKPAIQLSGLLEMPLDDAPVAIVTTLNEGFVPSAANHDLFLPNRLRAHLGLEDNARRYARDLYVLTILARTRKELRLIVARRDVQGEPLIPSRLLFAAAPEKIAKRILSFYENRPEEDCPASQLPRLPCAATSAFFIPRPLPRACPPEFFRVTEFRDYLASPYRYYLRHVLGLKEISDRLDEMDGAAFGTLVHEVLKVFGSSEARDETDPLEIFHFLQQALDRSVDENFGGNPLATVLIQVEQARRRLKAFAEWQAGWRQQGWRIESVERSDLAPVPFSLGDGRVIQLKGRIDRIDRHLRTGEWALFDYKTGDRGDSPMQTHRSGDDWCDLQLPLYRHLARELGVDGRVRLGYIILPRDIDAVEAKFADWSDAELSEADDVARHAARQILDEAFWVPLDRYPGTMQSFDSICQVGVFGQEARV